MVISSGWFFELARWLRVLSLGLPVRPAPVRFCAGPQFA